MTLQDCFKTLGSFISGFARFILFFASVFFLIISLILLSNLYHTQKNIDYVQISSADTGVLVLKVIGVYLVCLAAYGVYSAFFASQHAIRWFALVAVINVVVGIGVIVYAGGKLDKLHDESKEKLEKFQTIYDWSHSNRSSYEVKNATAIWDKVQEQGCCGLKGPADWVNFRPKGYERADIYPSSCCVDQAATNKTDGFCTGSAQRFMGGCEDDIKSLSSIIEGSLGIMIFLSFVLGSLSFIVVLCKPEADYYYDH